MAELITRTARLVPYAKRPKQVPSFVTAYSYEPLPDEPGAELGSLFVVIEVIVSGRSSEDVADLVINTLGDAYYNQVSDAEGAPARFEAAVKTTNQELAGYVSQGNAAWIGKMSAVAAVQCNNELHVAQTGSAEAFLYRGKASARITNNPNPGKPAPPSKTFGSIASGELEPGDRLLLATPALIHQLSLGKLKEIVSETSPNNAIAEITQLLRGGSGERIAALVIEATTPELAALQVRSEEPSEIQLGTPENMVEAAKMAAAPLAAATVTSSKRATAAAKTGWERTQPRLNRARQSVGAVLRRELGRPGIGKRAAVTVGVLIAAVLAFWWLSTSAAQAKQLQTRYDNDYKQYELAADTAAAGDKATARMVLGKLQTELTALYQTPGRTGLDSRLKKSKPSNGKPTSVADLASLTSIKLDELEGLHRAENTTLISLATIKNVKATHFELINGKFYVFDDNNSSSIYIAGVASKAVQRSKADTSKLGKVVATTLSSNNDGIYILTSKPAVWLYKFDNDTLIQQAVGAGDWPSGKAISSYGGNLYILGDGVIYKHVKTASGFSPRSTYLSGATIPSLTGATSMTVDGTIYIASPAGLSQFLSGKLTATAEIPSSLTNPTAIRSQDNGNTILGINVTGKRIGFWNASTKLTFNKQYELNGISKLVDVAFDAKSQTGYVLTNDKIVQFTP